MVGRCVREIEACPQVWMQEVRCSMHMVEELVVEGGIVLV